MIGDKLVFKWAKDPRFPYNCLKNKKKMKISIVCRKDWKNIVFVKVKAETVGDGYDRKALRKK